MLFSFSVYSLIAFGLLFCYFTFCCFIFHCLVLHHSLFNLLVVGVLCSYCFVFRHPVFCSSIVRHFVVGLLLLWPFIVHYSCSFFVVPVSIVNCLSLFHLYLLDASLCSVFHCLVCCCLLFCCFLLLFSFLLHGFSFAFHCSRFGRSLFNPSPFYVVRVCVVWSFIWIVQSLFFIVLPLLDICVVFHSASHSLVF